MNTNTAVYSFANGAIWCPEKWNVGQRSTQSYTPVGRRCWRRVADQVKSHHVSLLCVLGICNSPDARVTDQSAVYLPHGPDSIRYAAADRAAEYCDERVCVSVCVCLSVRDHIFGTTRPIFTKNFVHVSGDIGSVILCRCCDTLYNFCFMDNVISRGCLTSPPSWSAVHTQPWAWL